ncbi:MAG: hypothetical protein HY556_11945 [Euryarchaeota archaeon]|nr:hypothetical protein [Euryarchaeota archaeon]
MTRYLVGKGSLSIRKTSRGALDSVEHEEAAVAEAGDATDAVARLIRPDPKVVFLDRISPGEADGVVSRRAMSSQQSQARLVPTTIIPQDDPDVRSATTIGASGRLMKPIRQEDARMIHHGVEEETSGAGPI